MGFRGSGAEGLKEALRFQLKVFGLGIGIGGFDLRIPGGFGLRAMS